jgi:hypothetical protein
MAFHVPEGARITEGPVASDRRDGHNGAFVVPSVEAGWELVFLASDGEGWDHVSARAQRTGDPSKSRIPTWREMVFLKGVCWDDDDVVMQLHPRRADYVDCHPHVLHLWRPTTPGVTIPTPPRAFV